jgi:hypothetical protein
MTRTLAISAAFALLVAACSGVPAARVIPDSFEPFLLQFTDDAAETSGIGRLRSVPIASDEIELRIWSGFGIVIPGEMLRIRVHASGGVEGDVLFYYPHDLSYMPDEDQDAFRADLAGACVGTRTGREDETCWVTFEQPPDWTAIHRKLVEYGVYSLPDQSTLPKSEVVTTDGVSMVVELRQGAHYRSYEYSNPSKSSQEELAARRILALVSPELFRLSDGS